MSRKTKNNAKNQPKKGPRPSHHRTGDQIVQPPIADLGPAYKPQPAKKSKNFSASAVKATGRVPASSYK